MTVCRDVRGDTNVAFLDFVVYTLGIPWWRIRNVVTNIGTRSAWLRESLICVSDLREVFVGHSYSVRIGNEGRQSGFYGMVIDQ